MKVACAVIVWSLFAVIGKNVAEAAEVFSIVGFNTVQQKQLFPLENNNVIDLKGAGLKSATQINIQAISDIDTQSVIFGLDGAKNFRTESTLPHFLCGDLNGDALNCPKLKLGTNIVTVTPYSGLNGTGKAGPTRTVTFQIIDGLTSPPPVASPTMRPIVPPTMRPIVPPTMRPVVPPTKAPVTAPVAVPVAVPTPSSGMLPIRINVGGPALTLDGNVWAADTKYKFPGTKLLNRTCTGDNIAGTTLDALFCSERFFSGPALTTNTLNIPVPAGTYNVNLMFAETFYVNVNRRRFRVKLQGKYSKFGSDIFTLVGGNTALIVPNTVVVGTSGLIAIQFENILEYSKINAIEIFRL